MMCACGAPAFIKSEAICKSCYYKRDRKLHPERHRNYVKKSAAKKSPEHHFNRALLYKYGIGIETYYKMLADQGGGCAVCGSVSPGYRQKFFCVDHDHKTERIRGLLCGRCNLALGKMNDDAETIRKLADYAEYWGTRPVPRLRKQLPRD